MAEEVPPPADVEGWPMMSGSGELRRLRRDAESLGLAVTKIPERSRSFYEFGPYMITDPGGGYVILASGLDLEDVEKWLRTYRGDRVLQYRGEPALQPDPYRSWDR